MTDKELAALLREALRDEPHDADEGCPSTDDLWDFVAKTLPAAETERVHAHIATCSRCARDVGRLYRGLKHAEKRQDVIQQHIDSVIAPPKRSPWSVLVEFFRPSSVRWGLAAVATVLILVVMWKLRRAPREDMVAKKDGNGPKPAPRVVQEPNKDNLPPEPPPQPSPAAGDKNKPAPLPPSPPKPRPPRRSPQSGFMVMSETAKAFLTWAQQMEVRSRGQTDEPSLVAIKPHRTIVLSQTPELVAEATNVAGPFTFEVDEVKVASGGFEAVKSDVAGTKDKPVDKPSLTFGKPLARGKTYIWRVSAGEGEGLKESSGVFMVAEQGTADVVKKYADSPLQRAAFCKAHGLFLDALNVLDTFLTKHPHDAKAQRMKQEIERILSPTASSTQPQ